MRFLLPLLFVLFATPALACSPCPKYLTLDETISKADVVLIGKRTDNSNAKNPEFIEITAEAVLKGPAKTGTALKTKSWVGMCPFGIVAEKDTPAVFLLRRDGSTYTSVDDGCAATTLAYENGFITIDNALVGIAVPGMEVLSLKAFVTRFLPDIAQ